MARISLAGMRWISLVLKERFGLEFEISSFAEGLRLSIVGHADAHIYFPVLEPSFHDFSAAPGCFEWDPRSEGWTAVLNRPLPAPGTIALSLPLVRYADDRVSIAYDIVGLCYWMLSRSEEVKCRNLDVYLRFPARHSHAYRFGYLDRPIVDEWLDVLRQVIERQWPEFHLKLSRYRMRVSHDVDEPSRYAFKPWRGVLRVLAIDVLRQRNWLAPLKALRVRFSGKKLLAKADPANTFTWLMDLSELHGIRSAFYFICGRTNAEMDADYELEWPALRQLLREIHDRGHEIGIHPSFETYRQAELIEAEVQRLKTVCTEEGVQQAEWGGRMHYLRWAHPLTMRAWEQAGMTYDSTLGYADVPGFRCGTCHEYPAFDPVEGRQLNLRIRPLIAMDVTVMSPTYMGLGQGAEAVAQFEALIRACRAVGGCFTLLWHNSNLSTASERALYEQVLQLGAVEANA